MDRQRKPRLRAAVFLLLALVLVACALAIPVRHRLYRMYYRDWFLTNHILARLASKVYWGACPPPREPTDNILNATCDPEPGYPGGQRLDAWRNPIWFLPCDSSDECWRFVSAGPDGKLNSPRNDDVWVEIDTIPKTAAWSDEPAGFGSLVFSAWTLATAAGLAFASMIVIGIAGRRPLFVQVLSDVVWLGLAGCCATAVLWIWSLFAPVKVSYTHDPEWWWRRTWSASAEINKGAILLSYDNWALRPANDIRSVQDSGTGHHGFKTRADWYHGKTGLALRWLEHYDPTDKYGESVILRGPAWIVLAVLGTGTLVLAIGTGLWRRRIRRREGCCQRCGYNLTGNESGRCPECGTQMDPK